MSMTITYNGTTLDLDGERAPDNDIAVSRTQKWFLRRNYNGTLSSNYHWCKIAADLHWTGVTGATVGSLSAFGSYTGTFAASGLDEGVFGMSAMVGRVVRDSWTVAITGLNAYDCGLTVEQV